MEETLKNSKTQSCAWTGYLLGELYTCGGSLFKPCLLYPSYMQYMNIQTNICVMSNEYV
jgi:hypothetical protein